MKYHSPLIILFIVLIALIFRIPNINTDEVMTDEGNYALRAIGWNDFMQSSTLTTPWNWLQERDTLPLWTQLSFNDHPPFHFATIWLSTHIFGIHLWSIRLPSLLYGIGTLLLIYFLLSSVGRKQAGIFAALFLALLPWSIAIQRTAIQESGVMFWTTATVFLLLIIQKKGCQSSLWILTSISLAAGILTKYSAVIIIPLLLYWIITKKWYLSRSMWISLLLFFVLLSPVVIFNAFTYIERRHFDLQITRFLGWSTQKDWPANQQGIWQGNIINILSYLKQFSYWISPLAFLIITLGAILIVFRKKRENFAFSREISIISFGLMIFIGVAASLTLSDSGRSSIILPFTALAFGISADEIFKRWKKRAAKLLILTFSLLALTAISDRTGGALPSILVASFQKQPRGFLQWELWKNRNLPIKLTPRHYQSLNDWFRHQVDVINQSSKPIVVYDPRFEWFAINWYFFTPTFYSDNYPVVQSNYFAFMLAKNLIHVDKREIFYIQSTEKTRDLRAELDHNAREFEKAVLFFSSQKGGYATSITNAENEELFRIWRFIWRQSLLQ